MPLLNTIGIAGLVWCVSFYAMQVQFAKSDRSNTPSKELVSDFYLIAKLSLIPAVFAALASL